MARLVILCQSENCDGNKRHIFDGHLEAFALPEFSAQNDATAAFKCNAGLCKENITLAAPLQPDERFLP